MVRVVKRDPMKTSSDMVAYTNQNLGLNITQRTARNILRRAKIFARRAACKPKLNETHKKSRMEFALAHKDWTVIDWGKVLWSDESKFNLWNPDGGMWVRRPKGKRYDPAYVRPTVKYGGGSVMAWGNPYFFE